MGVVDRVAQFNDYFQASFRNGMRSVEKIHQTGFEIPINIARQLETGGRPQAVAP